MDSLLQLIEIEGYENIKDLVIIFRKNVINIINETDNLKELIKIKHNIHTLKGFFKNKKIVNLLLKIKYEKNLNKIKIFFEKVKKLISKELVIFDSFK
jgi:hypothetical protein